MFAKLQQRAERPDKIVASTLVSTCHHNGEWQQAGAVLLQLLSCGLRMDVVMCTSALGACERMRQWPQALVQVSRMCGMGLQCTGITFNSAMSTCCPISWNDAAWPWVYSLLGQLQQRSLEASTVTQNVAIRACCSSSAGSSCASSSTSSSSDSGSSVSHIGERWAQATTLLGELWWLQLEATLVTYISATSATLMAWQHAISIMEEAQRVEIEPNLIVHSATLAALERGERWQQGLQGLEQMERLGIKADNIACSVVIGACGRRLVWQQALEMLQYGPHAGVLEHSAAMQACAAKHNRGALVALRQIVEDIHSQGIVPTAAAFNAAIVAFVDGGRPDDALKIFRRMKRQSMVPSSFAFRAAIDACRQVGFFGEGTRILTEMTHRGFEPDIDASTFEVTTPETASLPEDEPSNDDGVAHTLKAFYINADIDADRRLGMQAMCELLHLDCERVVPPALDAADVVECVTETGMKPFQCSLSLAHGQALSAVGRSGAVKALVLEDDARLNSAVSSEEARSLIHSMEDDFVMGGWCDPSCAHAYLVTPAGAEQLLQNGFAKPHAPADCMLPFFECGQTWSVAEERGGKLMYGHLHCPRGYDGDVGLFCQDRSTGHGIAYYLAEAFALAQALPSIS